jgi:hypothetical protein
MEAFNAISAIALTFGLLGLALWALRSKVSRGTVARLLQTASKPPRQLRAIERLVLTPDCTLHLVEVDGRRHLFAVANKCLLPIPLSQGTGESSFVKGHAA